MSDGADRAGQGGTPDISVVIPTYKRSDRLAGVMAALSQQTLASSRFDVIAIDNASQDETFETLITLAATVPFTMRVLQTDVNHGPAPARNLGWMSSDAPVVVFLDDDCLPEPEWLASGLEAMEADPAIGVLQGRVRTPNGFDPTAMGSWYHCQIIEAPTPYFEACNIFYRHAALVDGGGFDESIGWWGEDSTLGWSVVEAGWGRSFSADAAVVHAVQARGWRWHFQNGLLERNMVKLAGRHPGFRAEAFWRPWAYRRVDFGFVLAVLGLSIGLLRFRPALLLAAPYLWWRRPRRDQPDPWRLLAENIAVDAARSASQVQGALTNQVLVV